MLVPVTVADVMSRDVLTVGPATTASSAAGSLVEAGVGSAVVVEDGAVPIGIVTEGDLVGVLAGGADPTTLPVATFMTAPVETIDAGSELEDAAVLLREREITKLPVLDDGELVGVITATDISYYLPLLRIGRRHGGGRGGAFERVGGEPETAYESPAWEFEYVDAGEPGIGVGDCVRFRKGMSEEDVERFAMASGDTNRLHLDDAFAADTRFGERIVHGTLLAGLISAALARIPGLTIYLSQDLSFLGPVPIGATVTGVCEVIEDLGRDRYRLSTHVYHGEDEPVIEGEATVLIDPLPGDAERPAREGAAGPAGPGGEPVDDAGTDVVADPETETETDADVEADADDAHQQAQ